ncbi:MAG: PaaI family thioesterase [Anaerolineae bacterium]
MNRESPASSQWLERAGRMMRGKVPPPIAELIGFTMVSMDAGQAVVEFEATERHANPMGTLHGGVLCDIADAAMGMACVSTLDEGETFTTLELKINFLKPV